MYTRFFKGKKSVSRKEIREAMEGLQRMKCLGNADKVNLVKLLIMYSFSAVFFSSTSSIVTKSMMAKFDSIKTLNEVCWPKEITKRLQEQVVKYRERPKNVSGCVYLMLYLLVEHTNFITPLGSEEALFSRMLKWDLSKVTSDNWTVIQKKLIMAEVKVDVDNIFEMESKLLEGEEELSEAVVSADEVEIFEVSQQEHEAEKNPLDALCQAAFNDGRDSTDAGEMAVASESVEMQTEELVKNVIEHGDARKKRERNERRMNGKMKREKKEGDEYVEGVQRKEADDKMKRKKVIEVKGDNIDAERAESRQENTDSKHLMIKFPTAPVNEVEESYGTDVYLETLTDNVDKRKYLLRREKTIRENFKMKCDYLENLVKTREVGSSQSEGQKLKEEIVLLEETYKRALKSFNDESIRSDLYMEQLIEKAEKLEKMYSEAVDELQKERVNNKWCAKDARKIIKEKSDTIMSCRERELNLMHQLTELRNNLEKKDEDFSSELQIYKEKLERMEKDECRDKREAIKELERENSELKLKAAESTELYLKLKKESDTTIAINQDKIKILMNDKDRILGKLKKTGNVAAENKLLQIKVYNLEKQIKANTTEQLLAISLRTVAAENDCNVKTDKKEYPLSSINTRSRRLLEQKYGKRKATCLDAL